jgi:hypothetical protein
MNWEKTVTKFHATFGFLTDAELVLHRMRSFHQERVRMIQLDESHVPLSDAFRLVLHLLPEEMALAPKAFSSADLKKVSQSIPRFDDTNGYGYRTARPNVDGFLLTDGGNPVQCYSQLFRNGVIEGVMARAAYQNPPGGDLIFRQDSCEDAIIKAVAGYLPFAKALTLPPPFWMFVAVLGCEGAKICIDRRFNELSEHAIDRNLAWLPETKIESFDTDPVKHLHSLCDVLWNSVGFERSFNFDEQGNRKARR